MVTSNPARAKDRHSLAKILVSNAECTEVR
jgi:hypothetical protein